MSSAYAVWTCAAALVLEVLTCVVLVARYGWPGAISDHHNRFHGFALLAYLVDAEAFLVL